MRQLITAELEALLAAVEGAGGDDPEEQVWRDVMGGELKAGVGCESVCGCVRAHVAYV